LSPVVFAEDASNIVDGGKAYGDFRLRFESVDQDNDLKDAEALTLRSRLGYTTGSFSGFSGLIEFEDSRVVGGVDDYNDGLGSNPGYSVIADPETTELDQLYLRYASESLDSKLGRQVITYDNQRFVGHVGWRQDRQTFDSLRLSGTLAEELVVSYSYIDKRNRIFAEERDVDSRDHLLNIGYKSSAGKLIGYSYLLQEDTSTEKSFDTYGIRFAGARSTGEMTYHYVVEYAIQDNSEIGNPDFEADYYILSGGIEYSGVTTILGYEVLGSDDGNYGFSTPLATLHKFNGWADRFLTTPDEGLVDLSIGVSGKLWKGKWSLTYHDFEADEASATVDDLGDEIDASYDMAFNQHFSGGIKYADYSAGDINVDTRKYWLWVSARF
jgi:hypothetical protein